jgi:hypothetical protein
MREYEVEINGMPHTLQLDEEGLKQYPNAKLVKRTEAKAAPAPANKARTAPDKKA